MSLWKRVHELRELGKIEEAGLLLEQELNAIDPEQALSLADLAVSVFAWDAALRFLEVVPEPARGSGYCVKRAYIQMRIQPTLVPVSMEGCGSENADPETQLITEATRLLRCIDCEDWSAATMAAASILQLNDINRERAFPFFAHIRPHTWLQIIPIIAMSCDSPIIGRLIRDLRSVTVLEPGLASLIRLYSALFTPSVPSDLRAVVKALQLVQPLPESLPRPFHDAMQKLLSDSFLSDQSGKDWIFRQLPGLKWTTAERRRRASHVPQSARDTPSVEIGITPLIGASAIGGASHLVRFGDTKLLLDLGLDVTQSVDRAYRQFKDGLSTVLADGMREIRAILISHAHIDHIGLLPMLFREIDSDLSLRLSSGDKGSRIRLMASPATQALARVMLQDTARLEQAKQQPAFSEQDAQGAVELLLAYPENERLHPFWGWGNVKTWSAGHILGSRMILVERDGVRLLFTGDFNTVSQATVAPASVPDAPVDILIMEHTYGSETDVFTPQRSFVEESFKLALDQVLRRGGTVLVPAFAVGRAQEILCLIAEHARDSPDLYYEVYLDGLARDIMIEYDTFRSETTGRYRSARTWLGQRRLTLVPNDVTNRREYLQTQIQSPAVIVASSGMLVKGSVSFQYAEALAFDPRNAIFVTGYAAEDSEASILLRRKRDVVDELGFPVRCEVSRFHFTAHASREGLLSFVHDLQPKSILLVHGDANKSRCDPDSVYQILAHEGFEVHLAQERKTYIYLDGSLTKTIEPRL